jgi:DNA-binding response OmpR family regulator
MPKRAGTASWPDTEITTAVTGSYDDSKDTKRTVDSTIRRTRKKKTIEVSGRGKRYLQ